MSGLVEPLWIGPVAAADRAEALRLVSEEVPSEAEEALPEKDEGPGNPHWLFRGAYRGQEFLGVQLAHLQPGRTAVMWPPRLKPQQGTEVALTLVEGVCQELAGRGVGLVYCFLGSDTGPESKLMQVAGFSRLAQLLYLAAPEEELPSQRPASALCFEPYCGDSRARLVRILQATYIQTLDCPLLNQKRDIEDVLAGYRATGTHRPELWQIVQAEGEDVGCLLLTDHPELESLELIYMGLIPSVRGRGWGMELARYAQWLT
ncbi:MAG TPA: hypothetical protein PK777_13080, partial [Thermoguttaceae bacterium]|nr:hypothetical protein [Thermoguttaceae bacterium]